MWKTVLIAIILIVLFLLFAPCICSCVDGFVSSCMKVFKLQMIVQPSMSATASSNFYLGTLSMRVRRIYYLNYLETIPLPSRKWLWNENSTPFLWRYNSPKRKGGNERVTGRKPRNPQVAGGYKL